MVAKPVDLVVTVNKALDERSNPGGNRLTPPWSGSKIFTKWEQIRDEGTRSHGNAWVSWAA